MKKRVLCGTLALAMTASMFTGVMSAGAMEVNEELEGYIEVMMHLRQLLKDLTKYIRISR